MRHPQLGTSVKIQLDILAMHHLDLAILMVPFDQSRSKAVDRLAERDTIGQVFHFADVQLGDSSDPR